MAKLQKLSIRLLRQKVKPEDAVRDGVTLEDWVTIKGSKIALDSIGGGTPKWASFLDLEPEQKEKLKNIAALGVVFLTTNDRWFAISFGLGHVKLDPAKFEHDFGLRVVLNSVDPKLLKSADVRTPDENTLSRRSQTSRGSDQTAFAIDVERDIVRGLAGKPKDGSFATRVAGSDGLTIDRKTEVEDLPAVCADAYAMYTKTDYREYFKWIDQVKHVREDAIISALRSELVAVIDAAIKSDDPGDLHLAFPIIYDPEKGSFIQYKGFRSTTKFADLDILGYFEALRERGKAAFEDKNLESHRVHEVDEDGKDAGGKWSLIECLATEIEHNNQLYVLSGGRWYRIEKELSKSVAEFFASVELYSMPSAEENDNEEKYNDRLKTTNDKLLCMDRKLVTPTGGGSAIEVCDFLSKDREIIHVKDKTSSSRLSHLFSQGTVSSRVLILDPKARDDVRVRISEVQLETGQAGFLDIVPSAASNFQSSDFTVVYAVLSTGSKPKLPFFSLLTFRQAARELKLSGFNCAFSWIEKPKGAAKSKKT